MKLGFPNLLSSSPINVTSLGSPNALYCSPIPQVQKSNLPCLSDMKNCTLLGLFPLYLTLFIVTSFIANTGVDSVKKYKGLIASQLSLFKSATVIISSTTTFISVVLVSTGLLDMIWNIFSFIAYYIL